ncbi:MAG: CpaD family pilus assembly protein [Novosphingobium sp.]
MRKPTIRTASAAALALSLAVTLSGCGGLTAKNNNMIESVHQPVVERTNFTFDVAAGQGGLPLSEQRRLSNWFDALDLRYGDRIAIDDPLASSATRSAVEAVASRFGILLSDGAPITPGYVNAGTARIVVSRSTASVPDCPVWQNSEFSLKNNTSSNYGCAVNGNLAAMVADSEDLVRGASTRGETSVMSSNKAIDAYRQAAPTGNGSTIKENATK